MYKCPKCGDVNLGHQVNYCWRCQPEHYQWDKSNGKRPTPAHRKQKKGGKS